MGGSGGGSSSGKIEYPTHITTKHQTWLNIIGDPIASNPTSPLSVYSSPGSAPTTEALTGSAAMSLVDSFVSRIGDREDKIETWRVSMLGTTSWVPKKIAEALRLLRDYAIIMNGGRKADFKAWDYVDEDIERGILKLDDRLQVLNDIDDLEGAVDLVTYVYPRYEAGMRDINAVQHSSFVHGRAVMEATYQAKMQDIKHNLINDIENTRAGLHSARGTIHAEIAKFKQQMLAQLDEIGLKAYQSIVDLAKIYDSLDLERIRQRNELSKAAQDMFMQIEAMHDSVVGKRLELRRMQVVAAFELAGFKADLAVKHARWAMDNWQYFGNLMAAPGGGTALPGDKTPSKLNSALGGGLSGAASGAMIGSAVPGIGTAAGAVVGGVIGMGASLLA